MKNSYKIPWPKLYIAVFVFLVFFSFNSLAQQSVTIGGSDLKSDAVLWLVPNGNQGLLLPAVSRSGFTPSDPGMVIFDTNRIYYWDGSTWIEVGPGSGGNTYQLRLESGALVLEENGSDKTTIPLNFSGDLSGNISNPTVVALNGISLPAGGPNDGQVLVFDSGSGNWTYQDLPAGSVFSGQGTSGLVPDPVTETGRFLRDDGTWQSPSGSGDMTQAVYDTNTDNVVDDAESSQALQGTPVSATAPTNGQVLQLSGGAWVPTTLPIATLQDLTSVLTQGNDAGGNQITNLADPTLNQDAATKAYVDGLIPVFGTIATQDANSVVITGGTISGVVVDNTVTGDGSSLSNLNAITIDGIGVDMSVAPTLGQVLKYDGTNWIPDSDLQGSGGTLPVLADAQLITSSGADNPVAVTPSGDVNMDNLGAFTIAPGAVDDGKIAVGANIDVSKLLSGVDGDVLTTVGGVPTWQPSTSSGWSLSGNAGTTPGVGNDFLGTTDLQDLVIATNGVERIRIAQDASTNPDNLILIPEVAGREIVFGASGNNADIVSSGQMNIETGGGLLQLNGLPISLNGGGNVGINTITPAVTLDIFGTDAIQLPAGLDAERPGTPAAGMFRFNTTSNTFEGYDGTTWGGLGGAASLQDAYNGGSIIDLDGVNDFRINDTGGGSLIMTNEVGGFVSIGNTFPNQTLHVYQDTNPTLRLEDLTAYWDIGAGTDLIFHNNLRPTAYVMSTAFFLMTGSDLIMANPDRGDGGRAFVHSGDGSGTTDMLVMNFAGDFENGIELDGPEVRVVGNLGIQGTPLVGLSVNTTDAVQLPVGTTAERPVAFNGMIRFNSDLTTFEGYDGATWIDLAGGSSGLQGAYDGGSTITMDGVNNIEITNNAGDQNLMFLEDATGNVGLGTNVPGQKLDVRGNDPDNGALFQLGNSDLSHQLLFFPGRTGDPNPYIFWNEGDPMRFATDVASTFTERMRIDANGFVGIGTVAPLSPLVVNGSAAIIGNGSIATGLSFAAPIDLAIDDNDTGFEVPADGNLAFIADTQEWMRLRPGQIRFGPDDVSDRFEYNSGDFFWTNNNNDLLFTMEGLGVGVSWTYGVEDTQDADFIIGKGIDLNNPVLFLQNSGSGVGINKRDPVVTLDISGTDAIQLPVGLDAERPVSSAAGMIRYNSTSDIFEGFNGITWNNLAGAGVWTPAASDIYYTSGNVGIGDAAFTASERFQLQGADNTVAGTGVFMKIHNAVAGTNGVSTGVMFDTYISDDTGAKGGVFFRRNGAFGVGDLLLSINSDNGSNSNIDASDTHVKMILRQSGRVGIATTTPSTTLEVGGTEAIDVPSGTDAQRPGSPNSGMIRYNTTSSVFEGYDGSTWDELGSSLIGYSSATATFYAGLNTGTIGSQSTYLGRSTGFSITSGNFNTFVGMQAGSNTTSGGTNIFVGGESGLTNTTGSNNTYVGYASGRNGNTNGTNLTLIGRSATVSSDNLSNATALGANAIASQDNTVILGNGADVGIGTSTPARQMEVFSSSSTFLRVSGTGAAFAAGGLELNGTGTLDWRIQPQLGILVFQQGDVDGAMTSHFYMNNNVFSPVNDAEKTLGQSTQRWTTVFATNGTINTSDRREKKDIVGLKYGLNEILALDPVTYTWKRGDIDQNKIHLGLIAQDVQLLIPEVVNIGEEDGRLGLVYSELIPVLIKATQEQQDIIEDQQQQIDELKQLVAESNKSNDKEFSELKAQVERLTSIIEAQAKND